MAYRVGLTGGIASGKSVVSDILQELGAYIIDTDIISREIVLPGTAGNAALAQIFPSAFCEGVLDRRKLRKLVFGHPAELEKLNSVTHPLIIAEAERRARECPAEIAVIVAPLLFETGMEKSVDCVITVACPDSMRINRLLARDNIDEDTARRMIASQLTDGERGARADFIIGNAGSLDSLRESVGRVYQAVKEKAHQNRISGV